ncbi:MAG TPA: TonB family protein [Phenylobacterium sp.]|nr:TonB family protein [Phenylobacterium sp.]
MKTQILALSAAALLLAASAAAAAPSESQQYAAFVDAKAESLLRATGIDPQGQPVSVRATVSPDGHLTGLKVLRSSGSPDTDRAVAAVLQKVLVAHAPVGLLDGAVTLSVGQGVGLQAQAQAEAQSQAR